MTKQIWARGKDQIPLNLFPDPDFTLDSYIDGESSHAAYTAVCAYPNWPHPSLFLMGPSGSGKTHLGQGWAARNGAIYLPASGSGSWPELDKGPPVFIDDAHLAPEADLFLLVNRALNGETAGLLLSTDTPPEKWNIKLPDLRSRLRNIPHAVLGLPSEDIAEPIIRKLFADKGREVKADLVSYIYMHNDRSPHALKALVHDLDRAASAAKRDITRSFAASYLKSIDSAAKL